MATPSHTAEDQLKQRILRMEIAPGELLDEVALAAEFGFSRTPVREIIQRLSGEGYVILEKNRGAKVAPMDLATIRQFFQAAPMIYSATARLATENANPSGIQGLKEIQRAYRHAISQRDVPSIAIENHRFHRQIGNMAASAYLMPSLARLLIDHTRISQTFYTARTPTDHERIATAADQHDAMIAAFEQHSPEVAVDLTLQHWALSRDQLERFVRPDPLPDDTVGFYNAV